MRKLFFLLFFVFGISYSQLPQVPQKMSHRGTAYNTSGQILSQTRIIVNVKIFEGSTSGTLVFQETHNSSSLITNQNGQYNIEIGNGTNQSAAFFSINWGSGQKWLEISIAPFNNQTNFVTGSSQLMSVPYALYSQNTNSKNSLRVLNNLDELRNVVGSYFGEVIYVKGHTAQGDGGGGNFIWRNDQSLRTATTPHSVFSVDNDGTIIQARANGVPNDEGRWIRQFNGYIDIRYFGVTQYDSTQKMQNAINFASYNANNDQTPTRGTTVFVPNGSYVFDKLILRNGITLIGDSLDETIIYSTTPTDTNSTDITNSINLFEIENGPVQIVMSNFNIIGREADRNCFYFEAKLRGNDGGLWHSSFKNIKIKGFNKNGIYLKGGIDGYTPNQFLTFENVRVQRINDNSNALKMTGQNGQITYLNCQFDGFKLGETATRSKNSNVQISHDNLVSSAVISFINSTIQDSDYGLSVDYAENITIDNCWFESLGVAINIDGTSHACKGINIVNSRFANAAGFGSLTAPGNILQGRCIDLINSQANIANNYVTVSAINPQSTDDPFVSSTNNSNDEVTISGNTFNDPKLGTTFGIMQTVSITSINYNGSSFVNGLILGGKKLVFVQNAGSIYRINSTVNASETIFIRANFGDLQFNAMDGAGTTGGNIFLNGLASIKLNQGQSATFIKIDNTVGNEKATYQLVSISANPETTSNWNNITSFSSPISNYDSSNPVRYRKKNGVVYLEGYIKGGTSQTNGTGYGLFTLPTECRPTRAISFPIVRAGNTSGTIPTSTVVGRIDILPNGIVYGVNYSNIWSSLSGISFVVD